MQRLFITFPAGAPGIGILLLRLAVAATLAALASGPLAPPLLGFIGMAGLALALLAGFMTTIAAPLVAVLQGLSVLAGGFAPGALEAATIAQSLALAFLGPGAYSVDSRLFGRRRLIFESREKQDED